MQVQLPPNPPSLSPTKNNVSHPSPRKQQEKKEDSFSILSHQTRAQFIAKSSTQEEAEWSRAGLTGDHSIEMLPDLQQDTVRSGEAVVVILLFS